MTSHLGHAVRAARHRRGWSREVLAVRAGMSWSAIAQIESGRRQNVRLSSLTALARALEVPVDYLTGNRAVNRTGLVSHGVVLYGSDREFTSSIAPFIAEGLDRGEPTLVVTTSRNITSLTRALGDRALDVTFAKSTEWYTSPRDALARYRNFLDEQLASGASWLRIVGEPIWRGRSQPEITQWTRYESLVNLVFADAPASIVCPYDRRTAPPSVLHAAECTHPEIGAGADAVVSATYLAAEEFLIES